jgi:hypothetical protein
MKNQKVVPIAIDPTEVNNFIAEVFPPEKLINGEQPLFWHLKDKPATDFPIPLDAYNEKIPQPAYKNHNSFFATSTVVQRDDERLRNTQTCFSGLWCVVLDDVVEKVDLADMPAALRDRPSWVIETKPNSFQYGYILDEPLRSLSQAVALVAAVFDGGGWDSGGKMPNKAVRLPIGFRLRHDFNVRLVSMDATRRWTPEQLLEAVGINTPLETLATAAKKTRAIRNLSGVAMAELSGVHDPVLEWLNDEKRIVDDSRDWVVIECPWADEHSPDSGNTAAYSPIGRGEFIDTRGFKCHHDHCSKRNTAVFLDHVAEHGVFATVVDRLPLTLSDYVFNIAGNTVEQLSRDCSIKPAAFRTDLRKMTVRQSDGKGGSEFKKVNEFSLWQQSEQRVTVYGKSNMPNTREKLVEFEGELRINSYRPPRWAHVSVTDEHPDVLRFLAFLEYLIPEEREWDYFIDWLASKVQDPTFRGAGILMVTPTMGIGRDTLAKMCSVVVGEQNYIGTDMKDINGNFNEYMDSLFMYVGEVSTGKKDKWELFEKLKDTIDPLPKMVVINHKCAEKSRQMTYLSVLMASNNLDALFIPEGDRRFMVIANALVPETPEFFKSLAEWLKGDWADAVGSWLAGIDIKNFDGFAPAYVTDAKTAMTAATESETDWVVADVIDECGDYIPVSLLMIRVMQQLGRPYPNDLTRDVPSEVKAVIHKQLLTLCQSSKKYRVNIQKHRRGGEHLDRLKHTVKPRNGVEFNQQNAIESYWVLGEKWNLVSAL